MAGLSERIAAAKAGKNPILRWYAILRPQLWEAPDFEKVAFVLRDACCRKSTGGERIEVEDVCDALAELMPEQREFWLRVEATERTQFIEGMTAMFSKEFDAEGT